MRTSHHRRHSCERPVGCSARIALLVATVVGVPSTMFVIFQTLPSWLGRRGGYFAGFVVYWIVCCGLLPQLLVKRPETGVLLAMPRRETWRSWSTIALLVWPLLITYA